MGNGHVEKASVVGDIFGTVCDKHGDQLGPVSMMDVAVIPNLAYNMFSMTKMMRQGWILGCNKEAMWLSKGKNKLVFDIVMPTAEGCVFAIYMTRKRNEELANAVTDWESAIKPITMQQAHDRLGHMSKQATKATARALKITLKKGEFKPCAACAAGKAKQKCIKQIVTTKQKLGQWRAFLDIATVRKTKGMPIPSRPNWRILVVDQEIQIKFSKFF